MYETNNINIINTYNNIDIFYNCNIIFNLLTFIANKKKLN